VLREIQRELAKEEQILLAVVYGGFLHSEVFRDVDLALFTGYSVPLSEEMEFCETLGRRIERVVGLPLDVKLLDYAPPGFRLSVLKRGEVVLERRPYLSLALKRAARQELRDLEKKREIVRSLLRLERR